MAEVIAVMNAGSSSIKFSLYAVRGEDMELLARGQTEGIHTAPRFTAKDGGGKVVAAKSWPEGTKIGHEGGTTPELEDQAAGAAELRQGPGQQRAPVLPAWHEARPLAE